MSHVFMYSYFHVICFHVLLLTIPYYCLLHGLRLHVLCLYVLVSSLIIYIYLCRHASVFISYLLDYIFMSCILMFYTFISVFVSNVFMSYIFVSVFMSYVFFMFSPRLCVVIYSCEHVSCFHILSSRLHAFMPLICYVFSLYVCGETPPRDDSLPS